MPWHFTDDVELYADHAWDLLASRPVENTIALTVLENLRRGERGAAGPLLFGWQETPQVSGAVLLTPPHPLLLAVVPDGAVDSLVAALRQHSVTVPGVNGEVATADRFAAAWRSPIEASRIAQQPGSAKNQRLYELRSTPTPTPTPAGRPRQATDADLDIVTTWLTAFQSATGYPIMDSERVVRDRLARGLLWLWLDSSGTVVAMAGRQPAAVGVARVGPVYTSPEHRRRGYGSAVTAACVHDALSSDAERRVVLFTDRANRTSNAIYQRIGFRPVGDYRIIRFENHSAERAMH